MRTLIAVGHLRKLLDQARNQVDESLRHFDALRDPESAQAEPARAVALAAAGTELQTRLCKLGEDAKRVAQDRFRSWQQRAEALADLRSRNFNLRALARDRARFALVADALRHAWYLGNSYIGWFGFLAADPSPCHGEDNLWRAEHVVSLGTELRGALDEALEACDTYLAQACFAAPELSSRVRTS